MRNLKITFLAASILAIFSCTEEEKLPDNVIASGNGLTIDLEWTTGGSVAQATDDVDLELYLLRDGDRVESSVGVNFEDVSILDIYADDTYTINIAYFSGTTAVDYTLYIRETGSNESISYEGSFASDDQGLDVDFVDIRKEGDRYTVIDL